MYAGVVLVTLGLLDKKEPKPEVGDLFKGFTFFLQSFLFVLVASVILVVLIIILGLIPCIGQVLALCVCFAASALLMFVMFLIVDRKMEFWPAIMESYNKVRANFWPFLGLAVVAQLIGGIGAVACGIGVIVTIPITTCILAVAYREVFGTVPPPPSA
jgi:uncharacterized membrane protein